MSIDTEPTRFSTSIGFSPASPLPKATSILSTFAVSPSCATVTSPVRRNGCTFVAESSVSETFGSIFAPITFMIERPSFGMRNPVVAT